LLSSEHMSPSLGIPCNNLKLRSFYTNTQINTYGKWVTEWMNTDSPPTYCLATISPLHTLCHFYCHMCSALMGYEFPLKTMPFHSIQTN
jgi:hypothetical protein